MSKVTIPEPEAFLYVNGEHRGVSLNLCGGMDLSDGTVRYALITTDQAEAYANAMVKQALEALNNQAQKLYESSLKSRSARDGAADEDELKAIDLWNVEGIGVAKAYTNMQKAIRALIPKEPPCET